MTFKNVNISAALTGAMYNFSSLQTAGSFNSKTDTITWYAANTPALASLAPGQSGTVTFHHQHAGGISKALVSKGYKNYCLSVTATGNVADRASEHRRNEYHSVTALTSKVGGEITLNANGYTKRNHAGHHEHRPVSAESGSADAIHHPLGHRELFNRREKCYRISVPPIGDDVHWRGNEQRRLAVGIDNASDTDV